MARRPPGAARRRREDRLPPRGGAPARAPRSAIPRPPRSAERAGRRLAAAAGAAHRRGDLDAEIGLRERASALLGDDGPEGAALLPDLVSALLEAGAAERAEALAERAVAVSRALGLDVVHARAAVEHERLRLSCHPESFDTRRGMAAASAAAATLRDAGDELGHARAVFLMCDLAWLLGDPVGVLRARAGDARPRRPHRQRLRRGDGARCSLRGASSRGRGACAEARARHAALAGRRRADDRDRAARRRRGARRAGRTPRRGARGHGGGARGPRRARARPARHLPRAARRRWWRRWPATRRRRSAPCEDARATAPSASDRWHEAMLNVEAAVALIEQGRGRDRGASRGSRRCRRRATSSGW